MEDNIEIVKNPRIDYIDAMRGFTMILVVYSHICLFTFKTESDINDIFILFRMPLFFFISGFMSYAIYTRQLIRKRIRNRIMCQLLPTIIVCIIFLVSHSTPIKYVFFDDFKVGYWFTIVMVEFFLLYMVCVTLINRFKISMRNQTIIFIFFVLILNILRILFLKEGVFNHPISHFFSISLFFDYLPFFMGGGTC